MNKFFLQLTYVTMSLMVLNACQWKEDQKNFSHQLNEDWELFSSDGIAEDGSIISMTNYKPEKYYRIDIPSTILSGLIQNGHYPDIYFGGQLETIDRSLFETPWWYRKEFLIERGVGERYFELCFEGINYRANIWLNGFLIASADQVEGPFGIWNLGVSDHIKEGINVLAVEVFAPEKGDLTIGFVDWSPEAPDRNTGLWRGVYLKESGPVSLINPHVASSVNTVSLDEANLTISATARNNTNERQRIRISASFANRIVANTFSLEPYEEKEIQFAPSEYKQLHIKNPKLWWPVNLGEAHLYQMDMTVYVKGTMSDFNTFRFGIRQIESYRNEDDHLGFKVNGQKVLIKGGGWVDDMLLADSDEKVRAQVDYVKHMNLNTIRLEGFWGRNKALYDRCDEQGVMLMIGWSCQWEWEYYSGRPEDSFVAIRDPEEQKHQASAYVDQVKWLRNHPSVFLWNFGSDKLPRPELEQMLYEYIELADTTRPLLSHCGSQVSEISGTSGVKMHGPYDWVSPNYWYIDKRFGGAYGFNTETGPGPQIPTLESIKRMIPADNLWPMGDMWNYHSGRFEFNTIDRYLKAFRSRYGEEATLERFVFKNQISNYEAIRPMFEAFAVNKYHSTAVIQWMLNSAWPKIIWQLYDYYLVPNAAFYGTKKACAPLTPIYDYGNHAIYVHNEQFAAAQNLSLRIKVLDISSNTVLEEKILLDAAPNKSIKVYELPASIRETITPTYFLDLRLLDENEREIANNFYWLSPKEDTHDWDSTYWLYTPGLEYADMTGINQLKLAEVQLAYEMTEEGDELVIHAELSNRSDVLAFFMELRIVDKNTGRTIVPVFWDDNYISLLPHENRRLSARISASNAVIDQIVLAADGWNVTFRN